MLYNSCPADSCPVITNLRIITTFIKKRRTKSYRFLILFNQSTNTRTCPFTFTYNSYLLRICRLYWNNWNMFSNSCHPLRIHQKNHQFSISTYINNDDRYIIFTWSIQSIILAISKIYTRIRSLQSTIKMVSLVVYRQFLNNRLWT